MFSKELKFASDCLINWFNLKFKKQNLELSNEKRRAYEIENPIDWKNDNCKICNFPLHINPTTFDVEKEKMSYGDFVIKKEHKFLRNIFSEEELMLSPAIKNLQSFHENFSKFLQVAVYLQNSINSIKDFLECFYDELLEFCNEFCDDCTDFIKIKEKISDVEVKSKQMTKIPKFTLQICAFVYQRIMRFPKTKFEIKTVTTGNLFEFVHKIINVKINLHHSHITGKIIGYVHDFCNLQVRENKDVIPCIAHNFFNFDIIFLLKSVRLSVWRTKDIHIGGKNLTDLNYASIDKFKFIDTMKYYQSSLGKLSETLTEKEKDNITKLTVQFLVNHDYFLYVWDQMSLDQKNKVVEIIVSGKAVIPYEKIERIDSLSIKPEDGIFFQKMNFLVR